MARKLQDRLALARFKTQHGMSNESFRVVEARVGSSFKRKRPSSSLDSSSDTSSSISEHQFFPSTLGSSPLSAPIFSDAIRAPESSQGFRKSSIFQPAFVHPESPLASRKRNRATTMAAPRIQTTRNSWKTKHSLPESSPTYPHTRAHFPSSQEPSASFASGTSTIPNSPNFDHRSDDEDHDLPTHSFQPSQVRPTSPRTPPPTRHRSNRQLKINGNGGEAAAEALMFLATSPSPANPGVKSIVYPPSTPPSKTAGLQQSFMSTPGGFLTGGFSTPGQQFNFADFVNVTPSPAQGAFGSRTPGPVIKSPLATKEARRRLNFGNSLPLGGSPNVSRGTISNGSGLGMELGGELVS